MATSPCLLTTRLRPCPPTARPLAPPPLLPRATDLNPAPTLSRRSPWIRAQILPVPWTSGRRRSLARSPGPTRRRSCTIKSRSMCLQRPLTTTAISQRSGTSGSTRPQRPIRILYQAALRRCLSALANHTAASALSDQPVRTCLQPPTASRRVPGPTECTW